MSDDSMRRIKAFVRAIEYDAIAGTLDHTKAVELFAPLIAEERARAFEEVADLIANHDEMHEIKGSRRFLVRRVHQEDAPNLVNSAFVAAIRALAKQKAAERSLPLLPVDAP